MLPNLSRKLYSVQSPASRLQNVILSCPFKLNGQIKTADVQMAVLARSSYTMRPQECLRMSYCFQGLVFSLAVFWAMDLQGSFLVFAASFTAAEFVVSQHQHHGRCMPPVHLMFASQWRFEGGKLEAKIEGWGLGMSWQKAAIPCYSATLPVAK